MSSTKKKGYRKHVKSWCNIEYINIVKKKNCNVAQ